MEGDERPEGCTVPHGFSLGEAHLLPQLLEGLHKMGMGGSLGAPCREELLGGQASMRDS